jgi:hypothetical protein
MPYRSAQDWARDPIHFMDIFFDCMGILAIVIALTADRRPLVFWNLCHLAILIGLNFSSSMSIASILKRFAHLQRSLLIFGSIIATVALYAAHREMGIGKVRFRQQRRG